MKFAKETLQNALWDDEDGFETVVNKITGTSRWSVNYQWIFKYQDKFYQTYYSTGATEYQEESPFEYEGDEIECVEVVPYEKTIIAYKTV